MVFLEMDPSLGKGFENTNKLWPGQSIIILSTLAKERLWTAVESGKAVHHPC